MISIGVYDAKTQLPKLLDRVSRGERFLITKHGRPVAQLLPAPAEVELDLKSVVQEMEEWQECEGPTLGARFTVAQLREKGRRF
jgi:prevent-host-death family protein